MRLATSEPLAQHQGVCAALDQWLRPGVGFNHPRDVLKDPLLSVAEKRAVLSSWASDASAVADAPTMRWLWGTPEPVLLADVREALHRLDAMAPVDQWTPDEQLRVIKVAPRGERWMVTLDDVRRGPLYTSGRAAEAAAKDLATRLADEGQECEIRIELRDRSLAARMRCRSGLLGPVFAKPPTADGPAA
jgi:hypothetical protein